MVGERFIFNPVSKVIAPEAQDIIDNPQLLANWIYEVAIEFDKAVQTNLTASNGVIFVGTDIQHEDTSEIDNQDTSGAQVVDTITFDTFGHVLSFTTRNLTTSDIGAEPAFSKNTAFNKDFGDGTSEVQAGDAGLDSIAGLTTAADTMIFTTASDAYDTTIITTFGRSLVDDATAGDARTTLGLVIGTDVQAFDAGLESISGLTTLADRMIFTTASDVYEVTTLTTFGRSLIDDADAGTARTTLGLGTVAVQAGNQDLGTTDDVVFNTARLESLRLTDAITAPSTIGGVAQIYVDSADGDLKVKFGDGFVAVIAADS